MTARWLVTGGGGQLGSRLTAALADEDATVLGRADLDITSADAVAAVVREVRPDVVINAAAYTAVDAAETDERAAFAVNADAPGLLATELARSGGRLVHVSTDYVFDGRAREPYEPADPTGPLTAYGRSKLAGEHAVRAALGNAWIVRTAWVYGGPGPNFVDTMRALERSRDTVDVVDDQVGSPTYVADLAAGLVTLGRAAADADGTAGLQTDGGVLHFANSGRASWFELARAVFDEVGADPARVRPVPSSAFPRPAPRPAWSVLSTAAWTASGLPTPRPWHQALHDHLAARREPEA